MASISQFFDGMHGVIFPFGGTTAPDGFLMCDGAAYSRTAYASLFAVIGTSFGNGNGSTTFNVPDLRGEFLRGVDNGRGIDGGRTLGSSQLDQMQRITGDVQGDRLVGATGHENKGALSLGIDGPLSRAGVDSAGTNSCILRFDSANSPNARVSTTTNGETRPRNVAVNFIIKS